MTDSAEPSLLYILPIPRHPLYFVTIDGNVYSNKSGERRRLTPYYRLGRDGQVRQATVQLWVGPSNMVSYAVSHLVLAAFGGPRPATRPGKRAATAVHINGDRADCSADNLRWYVAPAKTKARPAVLEDEFTPARRLGPCPDARAATMRADYAAGVPFREMADEWAISPRAAYDIVRGAHRVP